MELIDRQAVIEALHKKRIETMEKGQDVNHIWECLDVVAQVPSAQLQWIPCSEGLPKKDMTRTLTTISTPHKGANVRSGHFYRGMFINDNGDCWEATDEEVLAWMPLPEPYEERKEADEH